MWITETEEKRCKQVDKVEDMLGDIRGGIGVKDISAVARGLKRIRDYLLKEFPLPDLTEKKRVQANKLYDAAVHYRRKQLEFFDHVSSKTLGDLQKAGEELDAIVTEINGGKDPVDFESKTAGIFATAAMLAGGAR